MSSVDSKSDFEDANRVDHNEILTVFADQEKNGSKDVSPEDETISLIISNYVSHFTSVILSWERIRDS